MHGSTRGSGCLTARAQHLGSLKDNTGVCARVLESWAQKNISGGFKHPSQVSVGREGKFPEMSLFSPGWVQRIQS